MEQGSILGNLSHVSRHMSLSLEVLPDVFPHLVVPIGPFVAAFWAPIVQVMGNAGAGEDFRHCVGGTRHFPRAAASCEVDVASCELLKEPGIVLVCHVVDGVIKI